MANKKHSAACGADLTRGRKQSHRRRDTHEGMRATGADESLVDVNLKLPNVQILFAFDTLDGCA